MTEIIAAHADTQPLVDKTQDVIEAASGSQVVITEQQVAFSTAAAAAIPLTTHRRGFFVALRAMFLSSSTDAQPVPHRYPPRRDEFLESAAMKREMYRL